MDRRGPIERTLNGDTCPSCAAKETRIKEHEDNLRSIAGALGEFYGPDAVPLVEKIKEIRRERDEARALAKRLEEAVGWAIETGEDRPYAQEPGGNIITWKAELRRRGGVK